MNLIVLSYFTKKHLIITTLSCFYFKNIHEHRKIAVKLSIEQTEKNYFSVTLSSKVLHALVVNERSEGEELARDLKVHHEVSI